MLGRYPATGRPIDVAVTHCWKVRAERVVRFQQYVDTALVPPGMPAMRSRPPQNHTLENLQRSSLTLTLSDGEGQARS